LNALWLILVGLGFALSGAFVVLYGFGSHEWRRYAIARNLLAKSVVLTVLLGMTLLSAVVPVPLPLFLLALGALDAILAWRLVITWRVQHSSTRWLNGPGRHVTGEGTQVVELAEDTPGTVPGRADDRDSGVPEQR
jgi:hypothetical protein